MSSPVTILVKRIETTDELAAALHIRRVVFIEEQRVPVEVEIDEHDRAEVISNTDTAVHALALAGDQAIATGRLLPERTNEGRGRIGRVAVLSGWRGRGAGEAVMRFLEDQAKARGDRGITVAAQVRAIAFYEKIGYTARGDIFEEAGIDHRWMDYDFDR